MAKNIPITARVGKGLFGQKVSEPVLNVGQAGVSGNNSTRNIPSPAKQVSADSTGKRLLEGQANVTFGSKGPDKVIKGSSTTTYTPPTHTPEGDAAYAKKSKAEQKRLDDLYKKRNTKTTTTPDRIEPGEDTEQTEGVNVFNTGSAKTSFWRRQDDRAVTHTSRKKKTADIKLSKFEAEEKGLKGKEKKEYINAAKNKAKKEMWESRQAGYKGSRDASVKQSQQSTRVHGEIKGTYLDPKGQQKKEIADVKVSEQPEYELKAKMAAKKNKVDDKSTTNNPAAKPEISQTKSDEVKKVENTKDSGVSTITEKEKENDASMVEPTAKKSANGFFAKKSPLKMKYFK